MGCHLFIVLATILLSHCTELVLLFDSSGVSAHKVSAGVNYLSEFVAAVVLELGGVGGGEAEA